MSIQTEIDRINTGVAAAYSVMEGMGATMPSNENVDNLAATAATIPTSKTYYAVCSTAAKTPAKTVTVDSSFALTAGVQVTVKFTNANSVASPTLNVNGTGAKPIYRYGTTEVSTGTTTTGWVAGAVQLFTYDGTGWIRDYWNNTTYSNVSLGQGYATCSTAAATIAKTAALSSYALTANGIVAIKFTNDVPAGATLNINSKGAKEIYHRGVAITDGIIKAGDTATFIYNTYYHLISIDRAAVRYDTAQTLTKDQKVQARQNIGIYHANVKDYGAKGDNSTDDTVAFQNALANERVVFVPGGSYKLSGELTIESNCQLELAQDAVLYFTQTTGNCISMKMSANIVGNHATISVPYAFSGHVINIDGGLNTSSKECPPFTAQWDPLWKTARFITDLNIVKPDYRGFCYSVDGTCSGVAVYLCADYRDTTSVIWATNLSKLRIAGAFTYGIFAESFKDETAVDSSGWIHQLRVDGFIDGSEVGLYLKNIESAYASVLVLPRRALTAEEVYIPYAKWGICLENSINTNLLGSRVMDWNSKYSLWAAGNINQHIALLGTCTDLKLDDFLYYANPSYDIRDLIYTDTPSNLDSVSILEEPITRWFKPKNNVPYFYNGDTDKRLMLKEELDEFVEVEFIPGFTNMVPTSVNLDGSIFNGTGYIQTGARWNGSDGQLLSGSGYQNYGCIGLFPAKAGDVLRFSNLFTSEEADGNCNLVFYDANKNRVGHVVRQALVSNSSYYWTNNFEYTDDGFKVTLVHSTIRYVAASFKRTEIGENPAVSVNEEISYVPVGYLRDTVMVKAENIDGLPETYSKTEIDSIMGSYINDVDALLGGS